MVKVIGSRYLPSQYIKKKRYACLVVVGLIVEEITNVDVKCGSHWSTKYRSKSLDQGTCKVSTLRMSTRQGLVVVGLIVEEM